MIAVVKDCAAKLGHVPTRARLAKMTNVTLGLIRKQFGTYRRLVEESGLQGMRHGKKLAVEALVQDWARVTRKLNRVPTMREYVHCGAYSETPFRMRFGAWPRIHKAIQEFAEDKGWTAEWSDVIKLVEEHEKLTNKVYGMPKAQRETMASGAKAALISQILPNRPLYGAPVRQWSLAHYPINELGVVFLFGTLASELGYVVTRLQSEFPDCEAMRQVGVDIWQRIRIEFEYESSNFVKHGHNAKECDVIVCWTHNWEECPLEVVELRRVISNQ